MVLLDSDRITRVPPYSGAVLAVSVFAYETITLYGRPFQNVLLTSAVHQTVLQPRKDKSFRFGLYQFRSPLLSVSQLISFPTGT